MHGRIACGESIASCSTYARAVTVVNMKTEISSHRRNYRRSRQPVDITVTIPDDPVSLPDVDVDGDC